MEFYLAIRRNEVLIHITTQMNLEIRMRNERGQSQETTEYIIPFI